MNEWAAGRENRKQAQIRRSKEVQAAFEASLQDRYRKYSQEHLSHIQSHVMTVEEDAALHEQAEQLFTEQNPEQAHATDSLMKKMNQTQIRVIKSRLISEKWPPLTFEEWRANLKATQE